MSGSETFVAMPPMPGFVSERLSNFPGNPDSTHSAVRSTVKTLLRVLGAAVSVPRHVFTLVRKWSLKIIFATWKPIVFGLLVHAAFNFRNKLRSLIRVSISKFLEHCNQPPMLRPETLRTAFNSLPFVEFKPVADHTHPEAAADRSGASAFIDRLGEVTGLTPYYYQRSRADERNHRAGSREFYWTKDLNVKASVYQPPSRPLLALIDVDQYVDMPEFLGNNACPTVIYTFQPESVAKTQSQGINYSYTFNAKDEVIYHVSGGAVYTHQVWNWSTDNLRVVRYCYGIPLSLTAYLVDRRKTSPDHELILLTPQGHWKFPYSIPSALLLGGRSLGRLHLYDNGFTRLMLNSESGVKVSTGIPEAYVCGTVDASVDDTIRIIARTSKYDLTLAQVVQFTDGDKVAAAPVFAYHKKASSAKPDVICPVPQGVRRYQFDPSNFDPGAKPSMVAFMSPLVHDAFVPDNTRSNERQAIAGRVVGVRPKEMSMSPFLSRVMREFVECMVPIANRLDPVDYEVVVDRQDRPTQRRILAFAESMDPRRIVNSFVKKEPYANVKDPRVISTINGVDKMNYSMFTYSLEVIFKEQPWYAFGKNPAAIAARVTHILHDAQTAVNTDFSRFDGHGSNLMRELERMLLVRAFRTNHHQVLLELHRSQYGSKAYASFGTRYNTAFSRASGSPETSLFNSLVNAFVAFLALRKTRVNGVFLSPSEAYDRLGIYGGDDGLTPDVAATTYRESAKMIGQELTAEPVKRGEFGVKFLARMYGPEVWFGDDNSCCDVPRQLSKLHVTVALPNNVTPADKLVQKCINLALSDSNTPILGELALKSLGLANVDYKNYSFDKRVEVLRSWVTMFGAEVQYPNRRAEWMTSYVSSVLPNFDFKRFRRWLYNALTLDDVLRAPICQPPTAAKSAVPVVVDDDVYPLGCKIKNVDLDCDIDPTWGQQEEKVMKEGKHHDARLDNKHSGPPHPNLAYNRPFRGTQSPSPVPSDVTKTQGPRPRAEQKRPKETFEELKARKQKNGTWKDNEPLNNTKPANVRPKSPIELPWRKSKTGPDRPPSERFKPRAPAAKTKADSPLASAWRPVELRTT